nr:MAG TPA: hyaluronidase [Caudoviricetes sp.]
MSEVNLGRVQGGGIFYSTASSGTSIAKSTLTPTGLAPLVGDCVVFPNGDLRKITAVSGTNVTCGSVSANFKGDKGDTGTTSSIVKTAAEWESQNPVLGAGVFGYDSTNKIIKAGDGTTAWKTLPILLSTDFSFEKASWLDIAALSESGSADKYFSVGDEKTISLTTGEQVTLVILGFDHDDLTGGGKAGMTIGMKNLLATTYRMNATATNEGGWDESEMRTSTMATLLSQLPSDLQGVIKQVNKKATAGGASTSITTSADKLWLLAEVEVDGTTSAGYADEGEQYEYWKTVKDGTVAADRIKYLSNGSGSAYNWWLRSPYVSSSADFRNFGSTGIVNYYNAYITRGVSFGFCV